MGIGDLGRDMFSARGARPQRVSLLVGFVDGHPWPEAIGVTDRRGLAGFSGGLVDDVLMRITEVFQVVPRFFLALVVVTLLGGSIWLIVLVLGLTIWPGTARLLRSQVLTLRTRDYVLAARSVGVPEGRILLRHVLPGALPPVITQNGAAGRRRGILVEASLSFLGLGDPNVISWGVLLNDAQQLIRQAWWMSVFPGLAIMLTVLSLNLLADGTRRVLEDPHLSGRTP